MKKMKPYVPLVWIGALTLWIIICECVAFSASDPAEGPSVVEVQLSPKTFPNPHSPFWISRQELGFVTEEVVHGRSKGAVVVYDLQTGTTRRLLDRPVFFPTMLPSKDRLSYVVSVGTRGLTLFTISLAGGQIQEYALDGLGVFSPSWSPDGRKLVAADLSYDANLFIADPQTKEIKSLGKLGRGTETEGTETPDWSPDGEAIVYVGWDKSTRSADGCCYNPTISRLYVYDLRSRNYAALTRGQLQDRYPAYSPDGKQIAFRSNRSGSSELWMIGRDGKHLQRLTNMASRGQQVAWDKPSWNPDSTRIAFTTVPSSRRLDKGGFPFKGSKVWILQVR